MSLFFAQKANLGIGEIVTNVVRLGISFESCAATFLIKALPNETPESPF